MHIPAAVLEARRKPRVHSRGDWIEFEFSPQLKVALLDASGVPLPSVNVNNG